MDTQPTNTATQVPKDFYKDGVKRMIDEGLKMAEQMIQYIKTNEERLSKLERIDRKKAITNEREDFITFTQIHPIVYEYIVAERIFNKNAFKRYIKAAFGSPKTKEDQELIAKDKRNVYYLKNKQYALYYKYLIQETNAHASLSDVNRMYDEMVNELNNSAKRMLDNYEASQKQIEIENEQFTEEKKQELIDILKQRLAADAKTN
jgi:Zn-dependent M32 family carboxypeptidase